MAYRILVVEDEPDTRELLDTTLRRSGHRVDIASSGRDALQLLAEYSNDVILSSLHMPEMSVASPPEARRLPAVTRALESLPCRGGLRRVYCAP